MMEKLHAFCAVGVHSNASDRRESPKARPEQREKKDAVLFLHGMGGSAAEAAHYQTLFQNSEVIGLDYHGITPWETGEEIKAAILRLKKRFECVSVIGNSIGAFLAMHAGIDGIIKRAYFISPVVDMETIILSLMAQAQVTEAELKKKSTIPMKNGPELSWEYLCYVRKHPIEWRVPTAILYAEHDNLTTLETITAFAKTHKASLTVMPKGEHWFHTEEQMRFLDDWLCKNR